MHSRCTFGLCECASVRERGARVATSGVAKIGLARAVRGGAASLAGGPGLQGQTSDCSKVPGLRRNLPQPRKRLLKAPLDMKTPMATPGITKRNLCISEYCSWAT